MPYSTSLRHATLALAVLGFAACDSSSTAADNTSADAGVQDSSADVDGGNAADAQVDGDANDGGGDARLDAAGDARLDAGDAGLDAGDDSGAPVTSHPALRALALDEVCQSGPGVLMLNPGDDLSALARDDVETFCLAPGDYGDQVVRMRQNDGTPRVVRSVQRVDYAPSLSEAPVLRGLRIEGARDITVHGLGFTRPDVGTLVKVNSGSRNVVIDAVRIEGGGSGAGQIDVQGTAGDVREVTIQRSVLRDTARAPGSDVHCILVRGATGTRIVSNEIYDCAGDSVQVSPDGAEGTWIADNDMFNTPSMYTDCSGNLSPTGDCSCGENAVDIKAVLYEGSSMDNVGAERWLRLEDNRMWGFRINDTACSSTGSNGNALGIHITERSRYAVVARNLFFDSEHGIALNSEASDIWVVSNAFVSMRVRAMTMLASRVTVFHNTVSDSLEHFRAVDATDVSLACNLTVAANKTRFDLLGTTYAAENVTVGGDPLPVAGTGDLSVTPGEANLDQQCLTLQPHTGGSQSVCVPHPRAGRPEASVCSQGVAGITADPHQATERALFGEAWQASSPAGAID